MNADNNTENIIWILVIWGLDILCFMVQFIPQKAKNGKQSKWSYLVAKTNAHIFKMSKLLGLASRSDAK